MFYRSEYMAPTESELHFRRTARLLVYVANRLGREVQARWKRAALDYEFAEDLGESLVQDLRNLLCELSDGVREMLVRDAYDENACDLADWWEKHSDRVR